MTITEVATVRAMKAMFEKRLDDAYQEMRRDYGIVSGARVAYEVGRVALDWGAAMVCQVAEHRFSVGVKP